MKIELTIHDSDNTVEGKFCPTLSSGYDALTLERRDADSFYESLVGSARNDLGLLPPAVRWISSNQRIIVFERPPTVQYVEIAMAKRDYINSLTNVESYNIPIPWTVYYVLFDENFNPVMVRVFCRNEPLYSWEDTVHMLPLLNLYFSSTLCNPVFESFEPCSNLTDGIQTAYNMVWNSGWNLDLIDTVNFCMQKNIPAGLSSGNGEKAISNYFRSWEKLSILEVLETKWPYPKRNDGGNDYEEVPTFKSSLDAFLFDAGNSYGINMREMMVKIVNSFSA